MVKLAMPTPRTQLLRQLTVGLLVVGLLIIGPIALPLLFGGVTEASAQEAKPKPAVKAAAKTLVIDRVVAIVNDDVILRTELMMRVAPLAFELTKITDLAERRRRQNQLNGQVLDEMVNEQLVSQAAREARLKISAKEVQAAITDLKKQNKLDDTQLVEALRMQGYSMSSYRKDVRNQILRMRAVNTLVRPRVSVTDDDVRTKYDQKARRSNLVSKVKLQHILIALPQNHSEDELKAARDKAANIIQREKAGEAFATLTEKYSDDPATKNTGGDLGWIERGTIATEWESIVFAMSRGETRGPITGPRGLHVFHVSDLKDSKQDSFEKVKETLRKEIYRSELDKQTRLWVDELRKQAHYEIKL